MRISCRSRSVVAVALLVALTRLAGGAELPSRDARSAPPPRRCEIGGKPGFLLPDSDTCVKVSGSISAQGSYGAPPSGR